MHGTIVKKKMRGLQAPNDAQPLVEFLGDECPKHKTHWIPYRPE